MAIAGVHKVPKLGKFHRGHSIATYLYALVLVILIPAFAVSVVLINRGNDTQQAVVNTLINATVQAMGYSVDREVAGMATTLRVLAATQAMQDEDLINFHARATQALQGTSTYLLATDDEFNQILNTRMPFGTKLPKTADPVTAALALETGRPAISNLFMGAASRRHVFSVWLPVQTTESVALLGLAQNSDDLAPALQSRQLPEGWHAALIDLNNAVMASTLDAGLEVAETLPLRQDQSNLPDERFSREVYDGEDVVSVLWRSPLTGWRIVAWASAANVQKPLADSLQQLAIWALVIAATSTGVAFLIAGRIRHSVKGLSVDARRLGHGETVYPRSYPVAEIAEVSKTLAVASEQRQTAERDIRFLMRELAHRSKNQMAVIAAMAKQTARGSTDLPTYVQTLEKRILGLARSTDLLLANGRAGVMLSELVDQQLGPFLPPDADRVTIDGPEVRINPQGAQILGMALHELSTNATRYGAFYEPSGRLKLSWDIKDSMLFIRWREYLRSELVMTDRSGFGTIVLRTMVGGALGAKVERIAHPDGVEWQFHVPLTALDPSFAAARPEEQLAAQ